MAAEGWPLFEKEVLGQLSSRAEAVLLNPTLGEKEREFLRGELSYGLYLITLPREMDEIATAALQAFADEENEDE